jgi:hypothetical protein
MPSTPSKQPANRTPYLPTTLEAALLILYPSTLILGSLFALIDPTTRNAPYSILTQSHDPAFAPSYFAKKGNLFNTVFVKRGWFWITASYLLFLFTHPSTSGSARRVQGLARWALVTVWWVFVTQWFFGPAIIDRGFMYTGGACELVAEEVAGGLPLLEAERLVSGMACKAVGGKWAGGHDISGHVFLLVLGSMFLFEEVLYVVLRKPLAEERTVVMQDGSVKSAAAESKNEDSGKGQPWDLGVKAALGVGVLSIWMLLMTAIYFHTWFEKVGVVPKPFLSQDSLTINPDYGPDDGTFWSICGLFPTTTFTSMAGSDRNPRCIVEHEYRILLNEKQISV